jgi:hypothetical protein
MYTLISASNGKIQAVSSGDMLYKGRSGRVLWVCSFWAYLSWVSLWNFTSSRLVNRATFKETVPHIKGSAVSCSVLVVTVLIDVRVYVL